MEQLLSKVSESSQLARNLMLSTRLLEALRFEGMESRYFAIRDAHSGSCEEAFNQKLRPWFSSGSPLFWVSGKPGSGKSTLMKFLGEFPDTFKELQKWAGARRLVVASHFFWFGGSSIQKSQEGLLRAVLFNILRQQPLLVRTAFPDDWNHLTSSDLSHGSPLLDVFNGFGFKKLEKAFQSLTTTGGADVCYCIFIDGLDEFLGEKDDLVAIVQSLASMPNTKLCIASRPWNIFESAFGKDFEQKLYMQDLNARGIQRYVEAQLESLPEFKYLNEEEVNARDITQEIVRSAQGVFLWVFFVVRSLREGLRNFDRLLDLQNRLREFPKDLDDFFRQIFDSIEPIYRQSASRTIQIALAAREPLTLLNYWVCDSQWDRCLQNILLIRVFLEVG
jgi:hypothetical protein